MGVSDMSFFGRGGGRKDVLCACIFLYMIVGLASANVVLIGRNVSLSLADMEANFAPPIKGSGESGMLYVAEPLDACTSLTSTVNESSNSPFVLAIRGACTFEDKVRNAQHAGYKVVIVYDYDYDGALVSMSGNPVGIHIHAVFVSRVSGEILKKYAGRDDVEFWIIPTFENSVWSIMAISFILLLAMAAVLATCFFVRRHRIRREQPATPNIRQFHGMSSQLVKAMPSLIFTSVLEDNSTSATCAICLDDYSIGEKLRILPCHHKFHAFCVDSWLTSWRTFCPVCKQDARTVMVNPPASERTPLLSSVAASPSSSARLASFHSSVAGSPPIQIPHMSLWSQSNHRLSSAAASPSDAGIASYHSSVAASPPIRIAPIPPRSQSNSRLYSLANTSHIPNSNRPHNQSPAINISRSSVDLRNASSLRSRCYLISPGSTRIPNSNSPYSQSPAINISRSSVDLRNASSHRSRSHLISPGSMGFQVSSPINSRYGSPYVPSLGNGSPSYLAASSSRQSFLRHCSGASLSALASDHSLPGC